MTDVTFEGEFRQVFEDRFTSLYRYLDRLSGDSALAADIAQETFVRLYWRGALPEDPRRWLVTVAHNLLRDSRRNSARRLRLLARRDPGATLGDATPAPDAALLAAEQQRIVRAALDTMPERDRQLLLLRQEGYSYRELAAALGLLESSVGTLLARARHDFRQALSQRGHDAAAH